MTPNRQERARAGNTNKSGRALCIALAVLLVVQTAGVALYGWPGFAVGRNQGKSSVFRLKEGQTAVETESGVAVHFGPYNGMDGETVVIRELGSAPDEEQDGYLSSYDISVDGREEFDGLLTITLPYDESRTIPGDEQHSVLAQYLNPATGEWELVDYTVNTDDNTVTVYTDHLSRFCTLTVQNPDSPYALLTRFSGRPLDDETALAVLREFEQAGQPGEVANSLMKQFYMWLTRDSFAQRSVENLSEEDVSLVNDVVGWLADAGEIAMRGGGYNRIAAVSDLASDFTLGLSTVSLFQTMHKAHKGDTSAEAVAAEAAKLGYDLNISHLGTSAMKLSMLGVIAIDYSLNRFMAEANQTYKDAVFQAVIAYNESLHPRSDAEWYAIVLKLYQRYGDDPHKFNESLQAIMRNFGSRYFLDDPEEQFAATNEAGLRMYTTGALPATIDAQQYCLDQYDARLGQRLQPVLEDVFKKIAFDGKKQVRATMNELRRALNAPLTIEVLEHIPEDEKAQYAGATVVLARQGGNPNTGWSATLNKEGFATFEATILGYMQAGCPTILKLWLPDSDPSADEPDLTQGFVVAERTTTIVLERPEMGAEWFAGAWRYTDGDAVIRINIIDGTNCSYAAKVENEEIVTYTTYVFDQDTYSLKMAYSSNNDTGGLFTLPDVTFRGYTETGLDYISSASSGSVYQRVK